MPHNKDVDSGTSASLKSLIEPLVASLSWQTASQTERYRSMVLTVPTDTIPNISHAMARHYWQNDEEAQTFKELDSRFRRTFLSTLKKSGFTKEAKEDISKANAELTGWSHIIHGKGVIDLREALAIK
ncbi:hypothetical protein I309_00832 [Cryptococcus deuterogattii LA55]|nr:hypothetical protein I309_00832 [Cryptococcus deuterogattii LA55]KIR92917.1 hypothetical protein I304_03498 [Cryptococcus deuterogattii CBS 10090]